MVSLRFSIVALALSLSDSAVEAQVIKQEPTVEVERDRTVDFSLIRSYHWSKAQKPADNMANHIRLTRAIQKELEARGIEVDTVRPRARILYRVSTRTKVEASSSQRQTGIDATDVRTDFMFSRGARTNLGTLTLEMYDGGTNALIWRGSTTQELGTPDQAEKIINEAVKRVFGKFPVEVKEQAPK
jgi:hypothetical protein